jgi:acetyl-CoA carboxylase carboxyl transferase subunit beta
MAWFDDLKTPRIKTQVTQRTSKVPEGLWIKCTECGEILQTKNLKANLSVCPECQHHFRLSALERIVMLSDCEDTQDASCTPGANFEEYGNNLVSNDPLEFNDLKPYRERLRATAEKTNLTDAFVAGKTSLRGLPYHLGVFEFKFMGGSMGVVVGEKIAMLFESALKDKIPAVIISSSGGARMQEGILSLMQMAKTSALVDEMRKSGIPYISVLTDPTTGGVAASFALLGDVILAEPKALIGFAGPRVIQQTIRQKLPDGFQTSEFLLEHGFIDRIVPRSKLAHEIYEWMIRLGRHTCAFPKKLVS